MILKYASPRILEKKNNDKMSLSKNLTRPAQKLELKTKTVSNFQLKSILLVYISDNNRKFIDKSAAYALDLTNVRAIMINDGLNLFEISDSQLAMLKNRGFELKYRQISSKDAPKRGSIKVFFDGIDYYIELSAAYSLGLINVENFYGMDQQFYKISENILVFLNNKYDVDKITMEKSPDGKHR